MDLWKEIIIEALAKEKAHVSFPQMTHAPAQIIDLVSYAALAEIKEIVKDASLTDAQCVTKIVSTLERIGSGQCD